jgi:hypothetical protein
LDASTRTPASNASHTWEESAEDRAVRLSDYRTWVYRYQRGEPCRRCMWPFPNSNHVCQGHDLNPTEADWGA